jgi:hypothetical protein
MPDPGVASHLDSFGRAEAKLVEVRLLLLDPRPEVLDHCRIELGEVVALLTELGSGGFRQPTPAFLSSVRQVRRAAQELGLQIEHASKFCRGWIQLTLGMGYTAGGLPVLMTGEAGNSFEV